MFVLAVLAVVGVVLVVPGEPARAGGGGWRVDSAATVPAPAPANPSAGPLAAPVRHTPLAALIGIFVGSGPSGPKWSEEAAEVRLQVPAGAEVWFDEHKTVRNGNVREYVSPPLAPGKEYTYEVRVRWQDRGRPMVQTRKVRVRAGARVSIDFTMPAGSVER